MKSLDNARIIISIGKFERINDILLLLSSLQYLEPWSVFLCLIPVTQRNDQQMIVMKSFHFRLPITAAPSAECIYPYAPELDFQSLQNEHSKSIKGNQTQVSCVR